jgi:hypothetical protein
MPLINYAWDDTFGNIPTNRKAIAVRGWNPLNRNLLLDPEISNTTINNFVSYEETNTQQEEEYDDFNLPSIFNTTKGASGGTFEKLVQHVLRNGGIENNKKNLEKGVNIQETLTQAKRLSSGVMVKHSIHEVNNTLVCNMIRQNRDRMVEEENTTRKKRRIEIQKKIKTINLLRLTKPDRKQWNQKDCRDFVQYKKRKGDGKMPSSLPLLRQLCDNVQGRQSPDCSVHSSDNEEDVVIDGVFL